MIHNKEAKGPEQCCSIAQGHKPGCAKSSNQCQNCLWHILSKSRILGLSHLLIQNQLTKGYDLKEKQLTKQENTCVGCVPEFSKQLINRWPSFRRATEPLKIHEIIVRLDQFAKQAGIEFTEEGYPILPKESLIDYVPEDIAFVPIARFRKAKDLNKTILTAYENDELLYSHLQHIDEYIPILKSAYAITGFDFSPRIGTDDIDQKYNILLSRLVDVYLALHGVKILPNLRIGNPKTTLNSLQSYGEHKVFSIGLLGTIRGFRNIRTTNMLIMIYSKWPSFVLLYGRFGKSYHRLLDQFGISYRVINSFRDQCYEMKIKEVI